MLYSRVHESWARGMGTQLREVESGFRYTPTTTYETFPFRRPLGSEPVSEPRVDSIGAAAGELAERRAAWLAPPGAAVGSLAERTLTHLSNERPTWPTTLTDAEILEHLLVLNQAREPVE